MLYIHGETKQMRKRVSCKVFDRFTNLKKQKEKENYLTLIPSLHDCNCIEVAFEQATLVIHHFSVLDRLVIELTKKKSNQIRTTCSLVLVSGTFLNTLIY